VSVDRSDDARSSSSPRTPTDSPVDDAGLHSVVVTYESGPDRRTIYPADAEKHERLTQWLSADDDLFVDLDTAQ
jgi:hypothetical protein